MGSILLLPLIWFATWLDGAPPRVSIQFCIVFLIGYFAIRIMANVLMDKDMEDARRENTRRHFGRPSFRMWVDKNGKLHVKGGEDLDHATRCQNSLRDWFPIERKVRWNNWIYAVLILCLAIDLNHI